MSKTLIIVLVTAVAVLLAGAAAWAKSRGYCRMGGPERLVEQVTERLDLDETQKSKLEKFGQSLVELRDQWRKNRQNGKTELLSLLEARSLNRDKAAALLEQRHLAWRERGRELVNQFAEFSDSLTQEQRETLRTLIAERSTRRWQGAAWSH